MARLLKGFPSSPSEAFRWILGRKNLNSDPLVCTSNTLLTGHWALLSLKVLTLLLCKFLTQDTLTFRLIYVIKSMLVFSLRFLFLVSCLNSNFSKNVNLYGFELNMGLDL